MKKTRPLPFKVPSVLVRLLDCVTVCSQYMGKGSSTGWIFRCGKVGILRAVCEQRGLKASLERAQGPAPQRNSISSGGEQYM